MLKILAQMVWACEKEGTRKCVQLQTGDDAIGKTKEGKTPIGIDRLCKIKWKSWCEMMMMMNIREGWFKTSLPWGTHMRVAHASRRNEMPCFRPLFCTVKAELGRGHLGLMRWNFLWNLPQSSIELATIYSESSALPLDHGGPLLVEED